MLYDIYPIYHLSGQVLYANFSIDIDFMQNFDLLFAVSLAWETLYFPAGELDTSQVCIFQRCHNKSCVVQDVTNSFLI